MTTDTFFKDLSDVDVRKELYEERLRHLEENMIPFGFITSGNDENSFVDDEGDLWTELAQPSNIW